MRRSYQLDRFLVSMTTVHHFENGYAAGVRETIASDMADVWIITPSGERTDPVPYAAAKIEEFLTEVQGLERGSLRVIA